MYRAALSAFDVMLLLPAWFTCCREPEETREAVEDENAEDAAFAQLPAPVGATDTWAEAPTAGAAGAFGTVEGFDAACKLNCHVVTSNAFVVSCHW